MGLYPQPTKKFKPQISFVTLLSFYCVCPNFSHRAVILHENSSFISFLINIISFISKVILNSSSLRTHGKVSSCGFYELKSFILCSLCNTINECNNKQNEFFIRVRLLINFFLHLTNEKNSLYLLKLFDFHQKNFNLILVFSIYSLTSTDT